MKICIRCNISKEDTSFRKNRNACRRCNTELSTIRRRKNPEKYNIIRRAYCKQNSEQITNTNKKSYYKNRTARLATVSKRAKLKRQEINVYDREYARKNPDKRTAIYAKRRAAKLNRIPDWLTKSDWIEIKWAYKIARQLTKETGIEHEVDHIIPLKGKNISGLHCPQNLQILTAKENNIKKNKFPYIKG